MPHKERKTIGILVGYSLYEGNTISEYLHSVLQGVLAAASHQDCNVLIAGGLDSTNTQGNYTLAWPIRSQDTCFVPVGPWNTDGLLVIPPLVSPERSTYLQDLRQDGFPILFAGPGESGSSVVTDNAGSIYQAVHHLWGHGHRQIAFIAGLKDVLGDSSLRLEGYQKAMLSLAGGFDGRLISYGMHTVEGGRAAARALLGSALPFTALVASNLRSAVGALQFLKEAGKRIPEDIALIAMDEHLDAEAQDPPITTIYLNTFELGAQACNQLLRLIDNESSDRPTSPTASIPSQLIIRRSCGCKPEKMMLSFPQELFTVDSGPPLSSSTLSSNPAPQALIDLLLYKPDQLRPELLAPHLPQLVLKALVQVLLEPHPESGEGSFFALLSSILDDFETVGGDPIALQSFIAVLRPYIRSLRQPMVAAGSEKPLSPLSTDNISTDERLDETLIMINERARRQAARYLLKEARLDNLLGNMTAELLSSLNEADILTALAGHVPRIGIQHAMLAVFEAAEDDPFAWTVLWQESPATHSYVPKKMPTREFPFPGLYPDDQSYHMILIPLVDQNTQLGFLAFDASNLPPCGAIACQVAAALRTCRLFQQATQGRRLAEEADQMKSRLLSTVSHELRTPLNLIIGFSELILDSSGSYGVDLPSALLADINAIQRNSQHLSRLMDDVLTLNQMEAGRMTLTRAWTMISSIVEEAVAAVQALFKSRRLTLETAIAPDLPPVFCDATRIRQVFLNLLSNAGRFTEQGGVRVRIWLEEQDIMISIADTGPGIAPKDRDKIFEPFWQLDSSLERRNGGTGLGLNISKNFIEMHGGRIWLESQVGVGTTFYFSLPVTAPLLNGATPANIQRWVSHHALDNLPMYAGSPPATTGRRPARYIVLEEGDALSLLFRRYGDDSDVISVRNLENAIAELQLAPAQALLVSQSILENGLRLRELIAAIPLQIPIIACPLPRQELAAQQLGVARYMVKPVSRAELLDEIKGLELPVKTILLVDDQPEVLQLLSRILTSVPHRYRVLQTTNAMRALHMLRSRRPDLILLDLMMPDMDGYQFLQEKSRDETIRAIPVIVVSSRDPRSEPIVTDALAVTRGEGLSERDVLNLVQVLGQVLSPQSQPGDREDQADSFETLAS